MRVITESEGWRVEANGAHYDLHFAGYHDHLRIGEHVETEALLAIVADRLREAEPGTLEGIAWGLVMDAVHTLDCQGVAPWLLEGRLAARSPDTKQEEGR